MRFGITLSTSLIFASALCSCAGPEAEPPGIGMTKEQAQASESWLVDYCEQWGWYGDGICDDFCPQPDPDCDSSPPADHRPYCGAIGSRSEGWYWGDSGTLIKYQACAGAADPSCGAIGSRSEGWYADDELIIWDGCHQIAGLSLHGEACAGDSGLACYSEHALDPDGLYCQGDAGERAGVCMDVGSCALSTDCLDDDNVWVHPMCMGRAFCEQQRCVWRCQQDPRIALEGEACGPSIGYSCADGLYCQGLPGPGTIGGSGTCRVHGYCEQADDCMTEGNAWLRPACMGHATCAEDRCGWQCDGIELGPWSWTTHLVAAVESAHPYVNDFSYTWDIEKPGAEAIRVQLQQVDVEAGYDSLVVTGDREEIAQVFDGQQEHVWTREFGGDTLHLTLQTDYSVTGWGFKVASVSYYEQLPLGTCNITADCGAGEFCHPHRCFSPFAPCHGSCLPEEPGMTRSFSSAEALAIPDNQPAGVSSELDVDEPFACTPEVTLDVVVRHSYAGDLRLTLRDPDGASVVLWDRQGGSQDDVVLSALDLTGQVALQRANGIWKLGLSDHAAYDVGTLESWSLTLTCR